MNAIEDIVAKVIEQWNNDLKEAGHEFEHFLDVKIRVKDFYVNRKDIFKQRIAEMSLYQKGKPTLLLWRKELRMPDKVKGTPQHSVDEDYKRSLYFYFMYEAFGNFCNVTSTLIKSQDYCEYDIENDRLKADVSANGMIISAIEGGEFYATGDEFDVFMVTDTGYFVYTAHDIGRRNNGLAKIPKDKAMIKEMTKPSIITLDQL